MTLRQKRAVFNALKHLRENGHTNAWIEARFAEYSAELAAHELLGREPDFIPYHNDNGELVLNGHGDLETDI